MSMNEKHPISWLVSKEYAESNVMIQIAVGESFFITAALFFAVYYITGYSPFTLFMNDQLVLGMLFLLVPFIAVFLIRYNLDRKMPVWLRLVIKVPCAILFVFGVIHACIKLAS